jgi:hypothetical protein
MAQAFGEVCSDDKITVVDVMCIVFFLLLRPGEYTCTISDDTAFKLQDVHMYVQNIRLYSCTASESDIKAATSVSYNFNNQKIGHPNEKIGQGLSGDPWCCPMVLPRSCHGVAYPAPSCT